MANQEKDIRKDEQTVSESTALTGAESTAMTAKKPEKIGLLGRLNALSTPMKVGLGVVGGGVLALIGWGGTKLVELFMNSMGNDSDDADDEHPEDE